MPTPLKSILIKGTGSIGISPVRVRALYVAASAAGGICSISDAGTGATNLIEFYVAGSATSGGSLDFPEDGCLFKGGASITGPTGMMLTVFYD